MFTYKPKKSINIYSMTIAHRGYHCTYPENTLSSYLEAIKRNIAIELDIRFTSDGNIVCIHDRYARRLLGVKGRVSLMSLDKLKECNVNNTKETVPSLEETLKLVSGAVPLLIEVKGLLTKEYRKKLIYILLNYKGDIYFHAKNLITYYRLTFIWGDKVFYILNPFRKRFNFLKGKYYKKKGRMFTI